MDRRRFLKMLGIGVAGIAVAEAIPFGRVWSFPKEIVIAPGNSLLSVDWVASKTLEFLKNSLETASLFDSKWEEEFEKGFPIGTTVRLKMPQRWVIPNETKYNLLGRFG